MGIVLMGGTLMITSLIWTKLSSDTNAAPHFVPATECSGGQISLAGQGTVVDSSTQGQMLYLSLEKKDGSHEIAIIDMCQGKQLGKLTIETDQGQAQE